MSEYAVELTASARAAIAEQARYIAIEQQQPRNAERWLESVWRAFHSLERFPRRARLAAEDNYRAYEVRELAVGSQLLLFSIDDDRRKVRIIGMRGAAQRPRPHDLPSTLEGLNEE